MLDLRQLATFRSVATTLSFTKSANILGYAQSSVTAQIQALESTLGVPLFDRLGKQVQLTAAGHRLVRYAEHLLALADEAEIAVAGSDDPTGSLVIGAPETLCTYRLPAVLREFRLRYPRVQLIFRPSEEADLRRQVSESGVDMAFVMDAPLQANHLVVAALQPEQIVIVAPPDHHLAVLPEVYPVDLAAESMLLTEVGCGYRVLFEQTLAEAGIYVLIGAEFSSVEAIKQCVMAGLGLAVLPTMAVAMEIEQGRLVALPWAGPRLEVTVQMLWHKDKWLSPALRAWLALARERFGVTLEDEMGTSVLPRHGAEQVKVLGPRR
jgi:DNA-binding transcriptional LysR family regulator